MATGDIISIVNRSLGSISARSNVQNLNEGSTESNAAALYYQSTFEALARTAKWDCLEKQATLTLLFAAPGTPENPQGVTTPYPPNPWFYSYAVPADSLFVRQLVPQRQQLQSGSGVPIFPVNNYLPNAQGILNRRIPYKVAYGQDASGNGLQVINTNLRQAQALYTVNQPNPIFWDSLFQQAMVATLSVFLSSSVSGDKALTQLQKATAEGMIANARAADANEGTISQERQAEWIAARSGASGPWGVGYNTSTVNYENIAWPC